MADETTQTNPAEFPTDEHREAYVRGLLAEYGDVKRRTEGLDGSLDDRFTDDGYSRLDQINAEHERVAETGIPNHQSRLAGRGKSTRTAA